MREKCKGETRLKYGETRLKSKGGIGKKRLDSNSEGKKKQKRFGWNS